RWPDNRGLDPRARRRSAAIVNREPNTPALRCHRRTTQEVAVMLRTPFLIRTSFRMLVALAFAAAPFVAANAKEQRGPAAAAARPRARAHPFAWRGARRGRWWRRAAPRPAAPWAAGRSRAPAPRRPRGARGLPSVPAWRAARLDR